MTIVKITEYQLDGSGKDVDNRVFVIDTDKYTNACETNEAAFVYTQDILDGAMMGENEMSVHPKHTFTDTPSDFALVAADEGSTIERSMSVEFYR